MPDGVYYSSAREREALQDLEFKIELGLFIANFSNADYTPFDKLSFLGDTIVTVLREDFDKDFEYLDHVKGNLPMAMSFCDGKQHYRR